VRGIFYITALAGGIMEAMALLERDVATALGRPRPPARSGVPSTSA